MLIIFHVRIKGEGSIPISLKR